MNRDLVVWLLVVAGCSGTGSPGIVDAPADTVKPADASPDGSVVAGEILRDGDFEQLDGTGWLTMWTRHESDPNGQIVLVTSPVHSGTHAVQWQMSAAAGYEMFIIQDPIATALLVPGTTYEVTGWYMMDAVPATANLAWNYIVRGEPGDAPDIGTVSDLPIGPTASNTWQPFHYEFSIPLGAAPDHYMVYLHSIKGGDVPVNLTVDGASIHKKP